MQKSVSRRTGYLRGAAMALLLGLGFAAPAEARGLVADFVDPPPGPVSTCELVNPGPGTCNPISFLDDSTSSFLDIYVYADGLLSIGSPLTTLSSFPSSLSGLGSNFVAAGFADYSTSNMRVVDYGEGGDDLHIFWIFDGPGGTDAIFGAVLNSFSGALQVETDYGRFADFDSSTDWFVAPDYDPSCQSTSGGDLCGAYLPTGALVGSSYKGDVYLNALSQDNLVGAYDCGSDTNTDLNGYVFTPGSACSTTGKGGSVPEPDTWLIMAFGLGVLGGVVRRSRQRGLATAG